MKNENEIIEESIQIPCDMLIDILAIIVKEQLKHEIIQVIENRSVIVLSVSYDKHLSRHQNVIQNIKTLLADYNSFRYQEEEKVNWRIN